MLRSGMDAYVTKPVEPQDLFALLEQVVPRVPTQSVPGALGRRSRGARRRSALRRVNGNQAAVAEIIRSSAPTVARCSARSTLRYRPGREALGHAAPAEGGAHGAGGARGLPAALGSRTSRGSRPPPGCDARAALASRLARLEPQLDALAPGERGGTPRPRARAADRRLTATGQPRVLSTRTNSRIRAAVIRPRSLRQPSPVQHFTE